MPKIELEVTPEEYELWAAGVRIKELKDEIKLLTNQRTDLIKKLYEEGHSQAHISRLAGLTSARVSQIVTGYYDK